MTFLPHIQHEAALAIDAVRLISRASAWLQNQGHNMFHNVNSLSMGVNCDAEPVVPWVYGQEIMRALKNVSFDVDVTQK